MYYLFCESMKVAGLLKGCDRPTVNIWIDWVRAVAVFEIAVALPNSSGHNWSPFVFQVWFLLQGIFSFLVGTILPKLRLVLESCYVQNLKICQIVFQNLFTHNSLTTFPRILHEPQDNAMHQGMLMGQNCIDPSRWHYWKVIPKWPITSPAQMGFSNQIYFACLALITLVSSTIF